MDLQSFPLLRGNSKSEHAHDRHAQHSLEYMEALQDRDILRFCAIPQVMAIATLSEVYNNPKVFRGILHLPLTLPTGTVLFLLSVFLLNPVGNCLIPLPPSLVWTAFTRKTPVTPMSCLSCSNRIVL